MSKLVYGVGVKGDIKISNTINGKQIKCPYYVKWTSLLQRCYSEKYKIQNPAYIGCTVCDEWLTFSNFKAWMETQDWEGKQLDKDLLVSNNMIYSPDSCVFVSKRINSFLTLCDKSRGEYPIGVSKTDYGYTCLISTKYQGTFETILEAHQAWQRAKVQQAIEYQSTENDIRVKDGLQRIINLLTEDIKNNNITTSF